MTSSESRVHHEEPVWVGKPWVTPAVVLRTIAVIVVAAVILFLEASAGELSLSLIGMPLWVWTILVFVIIWLFSMLDLLILRISNTYILRQDGLEIKRGIIRLHSFVVTPAGFGDLLVYQSLGGRIFGYGDITVNSQGERQTKLFLVHGPFAVADTMRDIMGKPIVRIDRDS